MSIPLRLRELTHDMLGSVFDTVDWGNVWTRPVEDGVAFEWMTVAALAAGAATLGCELDFPHTTSSALATLFVARNVLPRQHSATPGHSTAGSSIHSPAKLALAALAPKVIIRRRSRALSLFREGWPLHQLLSTSEYADRPDIVLVPGAPKSIRPLASSGEGLIDYEWDAGPQSGHIHVRPAAARWPRPVDIISRPSTPLAAAGIVECSVEKSVPRGLAQLTRLAARFELVNSLSDTILVLGNRKPVAALTNTIALSLQTVSSEQVVVRLLPWLQVLVDRHL